MTNNRRIEKQAEIIRLQDVFIMYFKRYAGEAERITRFTEAVNKAKSELASLKDEGEKVMSADEIINKWELILSKDENMDITYSRQVLKEMLSDFKEYSHPSPAVEKCYPEKFVEWWFYNGCMNFAIEAFSKPVLFIKFDEGSAKKYTLQDLLTHWKEKVNN